MGEYAEIQWQLEARRGIRTSPLDCGSGRNEIRAHCPECGKGIRHIKGETDESMAQHMKAAHGLKAKDARKMAIKQERKA
jgi:hypothetical protein